MAKIKIGENEYMPDFRENEDADELDCEILDSTGKGVQLEDAIAALNDYAALQARCEKAEREKQMALDDFENTYNRLQQCLNDARCPECGCGDIVEAESRECGCDAPVCSIQIPETLGQAYHRVWEENQSLQQRCEQTEGTVRKFEPLVKIMPAWCMKLDTLARWFDLEQTKRPEWKSTNVQDDLRSLRDTLGRLYADPDVAAAIKEATKDA